MCYLKKLFLLISYAFAVNVHAADVHVSGGMIRILVRNINELAKNGASTGELIVYGVICMLLIIVPIVYKLKKTPWSYTSKYLADHKNLERTDSPKLVNGKEYNGNGFLIREVHLPEMYKEYYDNGKIKLEAVGLIVKENGIFSVQEGTITEFDANGNILFSGTYKDFERVS